MKHLMIVAICLMTFGCRNTPKVTTARNQYTVNPIGHIVNRKGAPVQLKLEEQYAPGLLGLEHCSHVTVVWWFDKNDTPEKRSILKVHPRGNSQNPLTGVFATHAPVRPNLIAITICKVLAVEGSTVTIDGIDAFDHTPILDLKSAGNRSIKLLPRP